jgi:hypothetical protein
MKVITPKQIIEETVTEVENEGLIALLGQQVTLFCAVYIYTGKLVGVNKTCVKLENPAIVYETGDFKTAVWKDAQKLPNEVYIQTGMIEMFGIIK